MTPVRFDLLHASIPAMVRAHSIKFADLEAIVDGDLRLTYAQLGPAMMDSVRAAIAAGISPGDRASVWSPNSAEWVIAALGILGAGGVLVPLNTRFKGDEAAYVLENSGATLLISVGEFLGTDYPAMLHEARPELAIPVVVFGTKSWEDYFAAGQQVSLEDANERIDSIAGDDLSDLMFTSGTTGRPKGVMLTHGQSLRAYGWAMGQMGFRAGDRYLVIPPFFHTFGYKAGWMASFLYGVTALPARVFNVDETLEIMARERISIMMGPPTLFVDLINHPKRGDYDLSALRAATPSAAIVPVELVYAMRDDLGFDRVCTGYGLTEASSIVSFSDPEDNPEEVANSVGHAGDSIEVRIVGPDGTEMPPNEPGEVMVRGYTVMRGYWKDPEATAKAITPDGWLHTGDVGVLNERGFLRITDRLKDIYITGGFNVAPADVERVLMAHPDIAHAAVIGVADPRMGEVGMAFVVAAPGETVTAEDVKAWASEQLANFKIPRYVEIVDDLPRNASMKVLKVELRARAKEILAAS